MPIAGASRSVKAGGGGQPAAEPWLGEEWADALYGKLDTLRGASSGEAIQAVVRLRQDRHEAANNLLLSRL